MSIIDAQELQTEPPAEVASFVRPKRSNVSLEAIQQDIKRTIGELEGHARRLEDYLTALRSTLAEMGRGAG